MARPCPCIAVTISVYGVLRHHGQAARQSEAAAKKKLDFSAVGLLRVDEGLCVQCMHAGPYDDEPATISAMHAFAAEQGYAPDFSESRLHHEIYLSDPRKCAPEKLKTVIRHLIKSI